MLLALSSDQEFFRETTAGSSPSACRSPSSAASATTPRASTDDYWRRGAELGWTSLLVERGARRRLDQRRRPRRPHAGRPRVRRATPRPGPLVPTNVVAAALSDVGGRRPRRAPRRPARRHADRDLGLRRAAARRPRSATVALEIRVDGAEVVLDGAKRPVESARPGRPPARHRPHRRRAHPGARARRHARRLRSTPMRHGRPHPPVRRRCAFDDVRVPADAVVGEVGGAADQVERQLRLALVIARRRVGRRDADRLRHDRRVGLRPLLVRPAAGVLPGAQAPLRRHEDLARGQPRHQRRGGRGRRRRRARRRRAGRARPRPTSASTGPSSCRTACSCTAASA